MKLELKNIDAVICDLDGTLYDKKGLHRRIICGEWAHLPLLLAERRSRKLLSGRWFGSGDQFYQALFQEMASHSLCSPENARRWYHEHYMPLMVRILQQHYTGLPWVSELIQQCHDQNTPLVVYSDYGCVREKLLALGYNPEDFTLITSSAELGGLKPCRESIEQVVQQLGVPADRCLIIGDRDDTDGASAQAINAHYLKVE